MIRTHRDLEMVRMVEEEEVLFQSSLQLIDNGDNGGGQFSDMIQIHCDLETMGRW